MGEGKDTCIALHELKRKFSKSYKMHVRVLESFESFILESNFYFLSRFDVLLPLFMTCLELDYMSH